MSDRKNINRYYPKDVDPSKVRFSHKKKSNVSSVRLMAPFSMKCLNCNEYISASRKFNARKETTDRDYLGIKIIRFNIRCPRCYAELIYETDPKNGDYQCIKGCKKNYERPKEVKNEESIDEMILRLEKDVQEDERMKELERKGGKMHGLLNEATGIEQLEKRLIEQQNEKDRIESLEILQENLQKLEENRENLYQSVKKVESSDDLGKEFEIEAKNAFDKFKNEKQKIETQNTLLNGYTSSSSSPSGDEDVERRENVATNTISKSKRSLESVKGVVKRKKAKIIT